MPPRLSDVIANTARRPAGMVGRLLYGLPTASHPAYGRVLDALELKASDRLLEIGCGGGHFLARALERAGSAAGLDHSPDMVDATRKRNAHAVEAGRLEVREGDVTRLPWPDQHFTAVAMNQVFFWLPAPDRALAEIHRVLRPGGRLAMLNASARRITKLVMLPYVLGGLRLYTDEELGAMVRCSGFTEVMVESRGLAQWCFARRNDEPGWASA